MSAGLRGVSSRNAKRPSKSSASNAAGDGAEALRLADDQHRPAAFDLRLGPQHDLNQSATAHDLGRSRWDELWLGAGFIGRQARHGAIQVGGDSRDIGVALAAGHREVDGLFERVRGAEQQLEGLVGRRLPAAPQVIEEVLHPVGEVGDPGVAHRRRHPLHRVHRPEDPPDRLRRRRAALPLEQQLVAGAQVFPALGQEQLGVLRQIHRYPSTRWTASSTREGWNGFTTKSLAPA